eukprot:6883595-Prymnesium_polylepis.1
MSDAVDGRSAARCRNTIVRQNDTFLQIPPTLGCGTSTATRTLRKAVKAEAHTHSWVSVQLY